MEFRSFHDMTSLIRREVGSLSGQFDLVVALPRSGMFPASLIAMYLNLPLCDFDGLLARRVMSGGARTSALPDIDLQDESLRVLIVDDSIQSGKQLAKTQKAIAEAEISASICFLAIYASEEGSTLIDRYFEKVGQTRVFEWNVFHHNFYLPRACVDIDGVLCRDPSPEENDYGPNYDRFLEEVEPLFIPKTEIGWLVTNRLERYRGATEAWLAKHGVTYRELIMCPVNGPEERVGPYTHGNFKGGVYKAQEKAKLFLESSYKQSIDIARFASKPVFCVDRFEMINEMTLKNRVKKSLKSRIKSKLTSKFRPA